MARGKEQTSRERREHALQPAVALLNEDERSCWAHWLHGQWMHLANLKKSIHENTETDGLLSSTCGTVTGPMSGGVGGMRSIIYLNHWRACVPDERPGGGEGGERKQCLWCTRYRALHLARRRHEYARAC